MSFPKDYLVPGLHGVGVLVANITERLPFLVTAQEKRFFAIRGFRLSMDVVTGGAGQCASWRERKIEWHTNIYRRDVDWVHVAFVV